MNEQETAANLFRLINESAGAAYLNRIHQLGFSQNVFRMNALELLDAVQRVKDPDQGLPLMMERHSEAGRQSHREVNRRVHNFVSSALTLVEHTRIFMRTHYAGTELLATYEKTSDGGFYSVTRGSVRPRSSQLHSTSGLAQLQHVHEFPSKSRCNRWLWHCGNRCALPQSITPRLGRMETYGAVLPGVRRRAFRYPRICTGVPGDR